MFESLVNFKERYLGEEIERVILWCHGLEIEGVIVLRGMLGRGDRKSSV